MGYGVGSLPENPLHRLRYFSPTPGGTLRPKKVKMGESRFSDKLIWACLLDTGER